MIRKVERGYRLLRQCGGLLMKVGGVTMASRWVLAFYPVLLSKRQRRFDVLLAQTILEF